MRNWIVRIISGTAIMVACFLPVIAIVGFWYAVYLEYNPEGEADGGGEFVNDFNQELQKTFRPRFGRFDSCWRYAKGEGYIRVDHIADGDRQAEVQKWISERLASEKRKPPTGLKSIRVEFYREYEDKKPIAVVVVPKPEPNKQIPLPKEDD